MGFRPREPSPPEASYACPPVRRRRVQLCPALPHCPPEGTPSCSRHPMAAPVRGSAGTALLTLVHLRNGQPYAQLAAGFGIGTTAVYRYVTEAVALLAALAPTLAEAMRARVDEGVSDPGRDASADRPDRRRPSLLLGHKKHGMNVQVIAGPKGRLLWTSPALAGAVHDVRAAREHGILREVAAARRRRSGSAHPATALGQVRLSHPRGSERVDSPVRDRTGAIATSRRW